MTRKKLSLVVPVYYEEDCIDQFIKETTEVLDSLPYEYEIVFVDDGSQDHTVALIGNHMRENFHIKLVEFSYNHGKQAAVTAGITYATGDYLLYMDPDLQDPPKEIPRFLAAIEEGYDLVFGVREEKKDSLLNRLFSQLFWFTLKKFTGLQLPEGLAVMRIFSRDFANQFLKYREQNRFIEGLFMHVGMRRKTIVISQRERFAGHSKFNFSRKMRLALDAILDYSELPLKTAVRIGFLMSLLGILALLTIFVLKILFIDFQAGWPSLIGVLLLGFGMQLFFTGVAALYIGRIYKETKQRPLFSVKKLHNLPQHS